jgi:hypothetical protein
MLTSSPNWQPHPKVSFGSNITFDTTAYTGTALALVNLIPFSHELIPVGKVTTVANAFPATIVSPGGPNALNFPFFYWTAPAIVPSGVTVKVTGEIHQHTSDTILIRS